MTPPKEDNAGEALEHRWASLKRRVALANGVTLAYVPLGPSTAPPVLLIHGFTDNSRCFAQLAARFAGWRLILPDLRGHGASDGGTALVYAPADMAMDIVLLLDALGIERATVVGHSLGGMVAQIMAAVHPERVAKLVLIGTGTDARGICERLRQTLASATFPPDPDGAFMREWYANPGFVDESFIGLLRRDAARIPLHVWQGVIDAFAMTVLDDIDRAIRAASLVIWGDEDPVFDRLHQQRLMDAIRGARLRAFAGCGHNPYWEKPAEVAEAIAAFLDL